MIDTVYVQKLGGEFINETAYSMWNGCNLLGLHVETFEQHSLQHIQLNKYSLVHGYVSVVEGIFKSLEVVPKPFVDGFSPDDLLPFYKRKIWKSTIGEFRKLQNTYSSVFIKPLTNAKAFTGYVADGFAGLIKTAAFTDDFEIMCSEPVRFVSEYRCFVHNGILIDVRRYNGAFDKLIDIDVALRCIEAYNGPVAYALDLAVTDSGDTVIVEINDAYSLGSYGMNSVQYANMIIDRWSEITGR